MIKGTVKLVPPQRIESGMRVILNNKVFTVGHKDEVSQHWWVGHDNSKWNHLCPPQTMRTVVIEHFQERSTKSPKLVETPLLYCDWDIVLNQGITNTNFIEVIEKSIPFGTRNVLMIAK